MFGELASGKRKQGRSLKRFKDSVKASISHAKIIPKELEPHAHDRTGWRALNRHAVDTFEERRHTQIEAREIRKALADNPGKPSLSFIKTTGCCTPMMYGEHEGCTSITGTLRCCVPMMYDAQNFRRYTEKVNLILSPLLSVPIHSWQFVFSRVFEAYIACEKLLTELHITYKWG